MHAGLNNHGNRLCKMLNGMCLIKDLPQLSSVLFLLFRLMMEFCWERTQWCQWRIATYSLHGLVFLNLDFLPFKTRIEIPTSESCWLESMRQRMYKKLHANIGQVVLCVRKWCWLGVGKNWLFLTQSFAVLGFRRLIGISHVHLFLTRFAKWL